MSRLAPLSQCLHALRGTFERAIGQAQALDSHHWQQHLHQRRIVEDGLRSTPVVAQRGDQFGVGLGAPVAADIVFGGRGYTGEE